MELRESILEGTLKAFNQKGLKFTMDDLAGILGMSKKTIYTVFRDKESLFLAMVDYLFDSIKESERSVIENESDQVKLFYGEELDGKGSVRYDMRCNCCYREIWTLADGSSFTLPLPSHLPWYVP